MEIKRKAYEDLLRWKNGYSGGKAMLIKGARRVGKSYLAESFGRNEYRSCLQINFDSPVTGTLKVFGEYGNKYRLDDLFNQLSVMYGVPLYPRESLIIFDEVQKYPKARELIKHLVADGRYDYIETGSLISIRKNVADIIIPSEEDEMEIFPLDFEEFLTAMGDEVTIALLRESFLNRRPLGNLLKTVNEKLRLYMLVGGMPQAVVSYAESRNVDGVEQVKRRIIKLYREDIAKYAEDYVAEATALFNAVPFMLSHHDKKVKFAGLDANKRAANYRDALYWMKDSMVANLCCLCESPEIFEGFAVNPDKVKCYMGDTGLLLTLAAGEQYLKSEMYKSFMLGKLSVNRGMMTENLVAQTLRVNRHELRFYETYAPNANGREQKYEIDFLIGRAGRNVPVEVKSGSAARHPSIDFYREHFLKKTGKGLILTKGDLREDDNYLYLPLAMTMFL